MKRLLCSVLSLFFFAFVQGQTTVFSDDFDSGLSAWTTTGTWGVSDSFAFNGTYSFADSPAGEYTNNTNSTATMNDTFDLSGALDANLYFRVKYDIENGFDYCYVDLSPNNGSTWTNVYTFNGENNLTNWVSFSQNIGGFVGNSGVKMRFRWYSDQGYTAYGIYIDSLRITSDTVDNAPPLIVHDPDPHYEGQIDTNYRIFTITDVSGVASAVMYYNVDGGSTFTLNPIDTNGNDYTFALPPQDAGALVEYYVVAVDSSAQANTGSSAEFRYVAGNYINHDNGTVSTVVSFNSAAGNSAVANRITLPGMTTLTTALIRNYTDINNPNDSIEIHVWENNGGNPGNDLITPFMVFPAATLLEPQKMTLVDLRPYEAQLDSLQGSVFIGFEVPSGTAWVCQTTGANGRGRTYNGSWSNATTTFHFRAVTDESAQAPNALFGWDNTNDPTIAFTDSSTNNPTAWSWDFGDGNSDTVQHPSHTYSAAGTYSVCLTATNFVGTSSSYCEYVTVGNAAPLALFVASTTNDPEVIINEYSLNNPTSWDWTFGDGATDTAQNPTHTYASAGTYEICLVASNQYGSDTACQNVTIVNYLPIAFFDWDSPYNNKVFFENLSSLGNPTATTYHWDFDINGDTSILEEPNYQYPKTGGVYNACLTASNAVGSSAPYCQEIDLDDLTIGISQLEEENIQLFPNPTTGILIVDWAGSTDKINHISLTNIQGELIYEQSTENMSRTQLNLEHVDRGVYMLQLLKSNDTMVSTRVILE